LLRELKDQRSVNGGTDARLKRLYDRRDTMIEETAKLIATENGLDLTHPLQRGRAERAVEEALERWDMRQSEDQPPAPTTPLETRLQKIYEHCELIKDIEETAEFGVEEEDESFVSLVESKHSLQAEFGTAPLPNGDRAADAIKGPPPADPGSSDLLQLDEFISSEPARLLTARSGRIDLAGTTASDEDIAPRVAAAALAIEDLIETTANSNLHATLHGFAQRYQRELGRLRSGEPGLSWYITALRIELYRSNYIAHSGHDPGEYPALEPGIGTLIDSVILATAMLAGVLPEIARSQEHIRQYSGEQVDVRTALRELVDPSLNALSLTEGVLTPRAAAVTAEVAALNIGTTPDNAPEAVRVRATKAGLLRGFLGAMARLTVAGTHQVAHLRENIRTKGAYDISKEVVKWLINGGYEKTYRFVADSASTLFKLATTWPAMFNFVLPLLRLLGLQ
jgi:hypothetical protein